MNPEHLAALERELEYAKHVAPGGQKPRRDRIKVIEAEIRKVRAHLGLDVETADGDVNETT
jgi:hypothetical protein